MSKAPKKAQRPTLHIENTNITAGAERETAIAVQKLAEAITATANALAKASSSTGINVVGPLT